MIIFIVVSFLLWQFWIHVWQLRKSRICGCCALRKLRTRLKARRPPHASVKLLILNSASKQWKGERFGQEGKHLNMWASDSLFEHVLVRPEFEKYSKSRSFNIFLFVSLTFSHTSVFLIFQLEELQTHTSNTSRTLNLFSFLSILVNLLYFSYKH